MSCSVALTESQRRILQALRDGPLQAKEVAKRLGVEPSSAYRHLVRLKADNMVEAEDVVAGPGRPKRMYHLTPTGRESFPRDYALLLGALIQQVEASGGRPALLAHLRAISEQMAGPITSVADFDARLERLVALYNKLGFEATIERSGSELALVQRNCPFLKTARDDPHALCGALDEGIIHAALPDADVTLDQTLARGDPFCRHLIRRSDG